MKDLVVLVADKDMEHALRGLLNRPEALGIRPITNDIFVHHEHDPACALRGIGFLNMFSTQYRHSLLMFDHEGSGRNSIAPNELQEDLNTEFTRSVWGDRAKTIVLSPELEVWIWSDSPKVDEVAGWRDRSPGMRTWLVEEGWIETENAKPDRPKEAFDAVLKEANVPRSASLYEQIASKVSLRRCQDASFLRLKTILQTWFPRIGTGPSN